MSKLHHRKFARFFPSYHPRAGEPTYFVEKIYASLADTQRDFKIPNTANDYWDWYEYYNCKTPKHHTIRAGHHVKPGDFIRPSVWGDDINPKSGRKGPYHSKQIIIGPDIEVVKVWDFELRETSEENGSVEFYINNEYCPADLVGVIAGFDGLSFVDFMHWFKYPKPSGPMQIICWNKDVTY